MVLYGMVPRRRPVHAVSCTTRKKKRSFVVSHDSSPTSLVDVLSKTAVVFFLCNPLDVLYKTTKRLWFLKAYIWTGKNDSLLFTEKRLHHAAGSFALSLANLSVTLLRRHPLSVNSQKRRAGPMKRRRHEGMRFRFNGISITNNLTNVVRHKYDIDLQLPFSAVPRHTANKCFSRKKRRRKNLCV
jgi:hypothetical protein